MADFWDLGRRHKRYVLEVCTVNFPLNWKPNGF